MYWMNSWLLMSSASNWWWGMLMKYTDLIWLKVSLDSVTDMAMFTLSLNWESDEVSDVGEVIIGGVIGRILGGEVVSLWLIL